MTGSEPLTLLWDLVSQRPTKLHHKHVSTLKYNFSEDEKKKNYSFVKEKIEIRVQLQQQKTIVSET